MTAPIRSGWPGGISSAAAALKMLERRQELVAQNLANTETDGYKAQRGFARLLADVVGTPMPAVAAGTDFTPGAVRDTGRALDVALEKDGFLVVSTKDGERLTRGGALQINGQRQLVTAAGDAVLGDAGPVTLPTFTADIAILSDGTVRAGGAIVGRLRMEALDETDPPTPEGNGRWVPTASRKPLAYGDRAVRGGALEASNAQPVAQMVEMLDIQRNYSLVERAIHVIDEANELTATRLAKPV